MSMNGYFLLSAFVASQRRRDRAPARRAAADAFRPHSHFELRRDSLRSSSTGSPSRSSKSEGWWAATTSNYTNKAMKDMKLSLRDFARGTNRGIHTSATANTRTSGVAMSASDNAA